MKSDIRSREARLSDIKELKTHIINYSKTRETYKQYRKAGYSKKFMEAHWEEIMLHKAAKEALCSMARKKIPKMEDLNTEC